MHWLFNVVLYFPLLNLLIFFYNIIPYKDIGISIILLTLIIRLALYPLTRKSLESQKALQAIQPEMKRIQADYKDDKEEQAKQMMQLYTKNKVNPLSSCFPVLLQLPILIAVFAVFRAGISVDNLGGLYSFVAKPEQINTMFLGLLDLTKPSVFLAILAAVGQFVQSKMMVSKTQPKVAGAKDESTLAMMNKQMIYMMPVLTVVIGITLPGGLALYWLLSTLFMLGQQFLIMRKKNNSDDNPSEPKEDKIVVAEVTPETK